ncbi:hypothetical protein LJB42_001760 [Komagataella kurtzmanii]|nr:hypothetical protein LJB42_001760 [Komagataella kurtzmanii]
MTEKEPSQGDLRKKLASLQEESTYWSNIIGTIQKSSSTKDIQPTTLEDPVNELIKVSKLLHNESTKMGLVFKAPLQSGPAYRQTEKFGETQILMVSIASQLNSLQSREKLSNLFVDAVLSGIEKCLVLTSEISSEYQKLGESSVDEHVEDDRRLAPVAKLWEAIDGLKSFCEQGSPFLLKETSNQSKRLIKDALEEFEEWIEDPSSFSGDPFGIDEADDEEEVIVDGKLLEKASYFKDKFKLIMLLLNPLSVKSYTFLTGQEIDKLANNQRKLSYFVDEIVISLTMNQDSEESSALYQDLEIECGKLFELVLRCCGNDDKKIKWFTAWKEKFDAKN